ncbi:La domain-containing protein [Scedosporium apiospermum]|uniref:La domain-containing protein n=1 Tax=Pseudallescheria apiosperma TaxID=563466 RepID=A0A084FZK1_PSEDA|nr:La domain-containing protein [Scedosporium apiospermum]KEZ40513.1 La domain-containing protein [Scedosporium apiospermum]
MSEEETKPVPTEAAAPVAATADSETTAKPETSQEVAPAAADAQKDKDAADENAAANAEKEAPPKPANILKTTAQINREDHTKNVKSDPKLLPVTDDPVAIRSQVEYYFGDSNLPRDKFMWESTGGEENKPVSIKTLCSFQRMRRFQPYTAVVAALRESSRLVVGGEEGEETIKRKYPYKPSSDRKKAAEAASVYVKGFGDEVATTQFDIEAFFAQYGPINYIKLRRTPEKLFKGSVFVEFQDEELAKKFIELSPKWKDHDLKIMTKKAYCDEKNELIRDGKIQPSSSGKPFFEGREGASRGRGRGRGGRGNGRGGHESTDPNDWKKRRDEDRKNGFNDRRGGRGRGRGRGFRGRGRGGRGGRDGRDGRDDRQNGDDKKPAQERKEHDVNGVKPRINATEPPKAASETNGKRARDDDGAAGERPAKKVDVKAEAA